ncbi:MAG TPA: hypothetical protein VG225_05135 [Terracidiphilus sp.]|jgi:hypothetical protein|nr:hypothetical protein [Terracidiphilus sp.]
MSGMETHNGAMPGADPEDAAIEPALRDFRASVHAWSDAEFHRVRPAVASAPHRRAWRRSLAWVLSLAISAGMVAAGVEQRHHQQELARQAQQRQMEQQRAQAEQHARESEDLLARVDSDVSREVPSAMEPLAQLMSDPEGK